MLDSKANLSSYCNEVARQLQMHYRAPPLPIDLRNGEGLLQQPSQQQEEQQQQPQQNNNKNQRNNELPSSIFDDDMDEGERILQFRQIAQTKHNIRFS